MITATLFIIMLFVMSFAIFPPEVKELEGGGGGGTIALNFGFDNDGRGDNFSATERVVAVNQSVESKKSSSEMLTSKNQDAVAIKETSNKIESKSTIIKPSSTPTPPKPQQPDKSVTDAIGNLLSGDGNTNKQGNQGNPNGNLSDKSYQSQGGSGTGIGGGHGSGQGIGTGTGYGSGSGNGVGAGHGNYKLSGRNPITMPAPEYKCNEEGIVVVEISVDKTGAVVEAKPGARGTTNTSKCLVEIAQRAALQTKFDPSDTAPQKQTGTITYNFKLKK